MIEEVHDHRRNIKRLVHAVIITHVFHAVLLGEKTDLFIQRFPVQSITMQIDIIIKFSQLRMAVMDVLQNHGLEAASQIEILQPDQIALILDTADDCLNISYSGKIGEMKQVVRICSS